MLGAPSGLVVRKFPDVEEVAFRRLAQATTWMAGLDSQAKKLKMCKAGTRPTQALRLARHVPAFALSLGGTVVGAAYAR